MTGDTNHSMTEALKGQTPANIAASGQSGQPEESGKPQATHDQVAEETRRRAGVAVARSSRSGSISRQRGPRPADARLKPRFIEHTPPRPAARGPPII